jgi:hypothetical protein
MRELIISAYNMYALTKLVPTTSALREYHEWISRPEVGDLIMEISTIADTARDIDRIGVWTAETAVIDEVTGIPGTRYTVTQTITPAIPATLTVPGTPAVTVEVIWTDLDRHQFIRLPLTLRDGRRQH